MMTILGATREPTNCRVSLLPSGPRSYVRCAGDLLLNGLLRDLDAETRCPVCRRTIRFRVRDRRVERLQPPTAVLHVVQRPLGRGALQIECPASQLFDTAECVATWVREHAGRSGVTMTVQEYLDSFGEQARAEMGFECR